jgi:hypothetical protein
LQRQGHAQRITAVLLPFNADDSFQSDSVALGRVFGVLHKYKIKAKLTFPKTWECRVSFIERVEELCKTRLQRDGPEFWKQKRAIKGPIFQLGVQPPRRLANEAVATEEDGIFLFDAELRRLADEAFATEEANREEWAGFVGVVVYDVDFSQ